MAACPRCGYGNPDVADFCGNPDCRADLRPASRPRRRGRRGTTRPRSPRAGAQSSGARRGPARRPSPRAPASTAPPPPASAPPPQTGPPPEEQKKGVRVEADPLELRVEPGDPPGSTTVSVLNKGSLVDDFHVTVNGPVARFAQVHPRVCTCSRGSTRRRRSVSPCPAPRTPPPVATRSRSSRAPTCTPTCRAGGRRPDRGRFNEMVASIEPEMTRGRAPGSHRLPSSTGATAR